MPKPLPESRICRLCGKEFKPKARLFRCVPCVNKLAKETRDAKIKHLIEIGEIIPHAEKIPEEMKGGERVISKKYREIMRMCSKMDREEFREYAKNKLNEIMENEILWKYLTREGLGETPRKDVEKEPKLSKRDKVRYRGDTRNMSWDDWEQLDFGFEEDD